MKRVKLVGLCLAAVFAVSAVNVSTASALPTWLKWLGTVVSFKFHHESGSTESVAPDGTVTKSSKSVTDCTGDSGLGKSLLSSTGSMTIKYTGCEVGHSGVKCTTPGAEPGEIQTKELELELGYAKITQDPDETPALVQRKVGALLKPKTGTVFEEYQCGANSTVVTGAVIGQLAPLNTLTSKWTLSFSQQEGVQNPRFFEGGPVEQLETAVNGGSPEQSGIETVENITLSEPAEISAEIDTASPKFLTKAAIGEVAPNVKVTATLGASFFESTSKSKITCTGGTATGEVTGPQTITNDIATYTGCELAGFKCESSGQPEGVVVTKALEGVLRNVTATLPGIRLFDEAEGKGGKFAIFSCAGGAISVVVKGSVIGTLSGSSGTNPETGKLVASLKLTFAQSGGIQKYSKFLGGEEGTEQLLSSVGGGEYEKVGQSVIATLKTVPTAGQLGVTK